MAEKDTDKISKVERYKVVTAQMQYFNEKIIEALKLYIQLVTAITGGYIWLRSNPSTLQTMQWVQTAIPALMLFVGFTISLLIGFNFSTWWGYRMAESKLLNGIVPSPVFPKSARQEIIMVVVVIVSSGIFAWYFAQ